MSRFSLIIFLMLCFSSSYAENLTGRFDYYVLALSWQPAFCEFQPHKPECKKQEAADFSAHNMVLHGLWPNRLGDKKYRYAYCSGKPKRTSWCDLKSFYGSKKLDMVMPGAASCLHKYEWVKHGSCSGLSENIYFERSIGLVEQFAKTHLSSLIEQNVGKTIRIDKLMQAWRQDYAQGMDSITFVCRRKAARRYLVEIRVALSRELEKDGDIRHFYKDWKGANRSCGSQIYIDPVGIQGLQ